MNHNYQNVKETITTQGIDIPESYIKKALIEYGLEEFPEVGLSDIGLSKLVKTAIDIYHSEIDLTQRKSKKGYLPVPKIKESKQKNKFQDLETKVEENSGDNWNIVKDIFFGVAGATLGAFFVNSSMQRTIESEYPRGLAVLGGASISFMVYGLLITHNPKLVPYILGTQLFTNAISGIYERRKSIKGEAIEKQREEIKMSQMNKEAEEKFISEKIDEFAKEFKNEKDRKGSENVRELRELCYKTNLCRECGFSLCEYFRENPDKEHKLTKKELEEITEEIKMENISQSERAHLMYVVAKGYSIKKSAEDFQKEKRVYKKCHHDCSVCSRVNCSFYGSNQYP